MALQAAQARRTGARTAAGAPDAPTPSPLSRLRSSAGGLLAAVVTYLLLASGVVPPVAALALVAVLLATVPTSPELSRRVALNAGIVLGWVPLLWWVRWPLEVNHAGAAVAVAVGTLVAITAGAPRARLRRLVPVVHTADVLMAVSGVLALAAMWRWAAADSARAALVAMLPGADNYAHFHMFATIRTYGGTTSALGAAPDGSAWAFWNYPQSFHALAATVTELTHPTLSPGPTMLVAYSQAVAVLVVLGVMVLTAAAVSLPGLRKRPLVALPVVAVTWAAFLWEPSQHLLTDGFANFWLASVAVAVACLVALAPSRPLALPDVTAVGGLMIFAAHAWAPMAVLLAPAGLVVLVPLWQVLRGIGPAGDRPSRRRIRLVLAILVLTVLAVLHAAFQVFAGFGMSPILNALGGLQGTHPAPAFLLLVLALYVLAAGPALLADRANDREALACASRARLLLLVPLLGAGMCAALFVAQLRTLGTTSYYFLKLFMGVELVLASLVPAVVGMLVAAAVPAVRRRGRVVVAVLVTLASTQSFGRFPNGTPALYDEGLDGTAAMSTFDAGRVADGILSAVDGQQAAGSFQLDYLALGPDRAAQAFYPNGWFHGILASYTMSAWDRNDVLRVPAQGPDEAGPLVTELLTAQPGLRILVAPDQVAPVRERLGSPQLAARVIPWGDSDRDG